MATLTNSGLAMETNALAGASGTYTVAKYIGWGIGTTAEAVTQTALVSEVNSAGTTGTNRGTGGTVTRTTTTVTNDTLQVVQTLSATGTINVTEFGLFDAATSGNMLVRHVMGAQQVVSGGSIQFTISIQLS